MADWWDSSFIRIVLPLGTYVGGVLSKPVTTIIEDWQARRKLKRAIYTELAANVELLIDLYRDKPPFGNRSRAHTDLRKTMYTICYKEGEKNPLLFNSLTEANAFHNFYRQLSRAPDYEESSYSWQCFVHHTINGYLLFPLKKGQLDKDFLLKTGTEYLRAHINLWCLSYTFSLPSEKSSSSTS